nr:uncharacterized protein LOC106691841 [Halyomorpha halys]
MLFFSCNAKNSKPNFDITVKEVVQCEDGGTNELSFSSTRLNKVSKTTYDYATDYTLAITVDDNLSAVSDVQAWGNGGWRPAFFTFDTPQLCSGAKHMNPKFFKLFLNGTGKNDCPVPPGTYHMSAHNISLVEVKNVPMWQYGRYKVLNQLYKEAVLVGCFGAIVEVTPIRRPLKRKH